MINDGEVLQVLQLADLSPADGDLMAIPDLDLQLSYLGKGSKMGSLRSFDDKH